MKKILIILLVVLLLAGAAGGGIWWYKETHIFVEGQAYAKDLTELDLRGTGASQSVFDQIHAQLPGCSILWDVPFQGKTFSSDTRELTITDLTPQDEAMLAYFPELKKIDATGCSNYSMLEALRQNHPDLEIPYFVDLGQGGVEPEATALTLRAGEFDYALLLENLKYLPDMQELSFPKTELTDEELAAITEAFPDIRVSYTLALLDREYAPDITELDLSDLTSDAVADVAPLLVRFANLSQVELMTADGTSQLSVADVKALNDARPDAVFHYTFQYQGVTISTTDESVHIRSKKIGEAGVEELRQVLSIMEGCDKFLMEYCQIPNETMAQLREDYRDRAKLVWRVAFGGGSTLTDAEIIRSTYDLVDDNCHDLVYCEDARYIDFGHNEYLDTCDFVAGMPNLEFIILSGAPIKDLTPFQNCKKLKILEIAFCHYIEDISPLAQCESLEMLNIGATQVTDLSPLDELNMTMLMASGGKVPQEERDRFAEVHPDCWATYKGNQYGPGWRYDTDDKQLDWYKNIADVFGYPDPYNNVGWYLKK